MEIEICSQTDLWDCNKTGCVSVRSRWKRRSRNLLALSSAAASLLVASGFVSADSAAANEHDSQETDPTGVENSLESNQTKVRERPCCAGQGLTDKQIQDMPDAEWAALVANSDREERLQRQLIEDQDDYLVWEIFYDNVEELAKESALALELNDLYRARQLLEEAEKTWDLAPEVSDAYVEGQGGEPDGVENLLEAVEQALNDGGRPIIGDLRAELGLPELPARVVPTTPEPEVPLRGVIAVDDLDIGSLPWALDEVLSGDPFATETVKVTLTQANGENQVSAVVEVELIDGEIADVTVDGLPIQSVRDRVKRGLARVQLSKSADDPPAEDPPPMSGSEEIQGASEPLGFNGSYLSPSDLGFTSSIDANLWDSSKWLEPIPPVEEWLSQNFNGTWSFSGDSEIGNPTEVEDPHTIVDPADVSKTNNSRAGESSDVDRDDSDFPEFSFGTDSTSEDRISSFASVDLIGNGFSTSQDLVEHDSLGVGAVDRAAGFEDLSFETSLDNNSFADDLFDNDSSLASSSSQRSLTNDSDFDSDSDSQQFNDLAFETSLNNPIAEDPSPETASNQRSFMSDSDSDYSGFEDLSFETSLDSNSFADDSIETSLDNDSLSGHSGFGDLSLSTATSEGDTGDYGFSPAGSIGDETLGYSVDDVDSNSSDSGSSGGFSISFGSFSFEW